MPLGTLTGDTVSNLLISSVAANTQAHENIAAQPMKRLLAPEEVAPTANRDKFVV